MTLAERPAGRGAGGAGRLWFGTMSFVHLHCHSEYSLLDGANRIDSLIRRAQELEMPALAVTDHGNMHAAWEFQEKARKAKLKPILGMEAYVAPGSRLERGRPKAGAKPYHHLVLLARDAAGYKNLVKLSSLAYLEGFYVKPRVDRELLAAHSEGIIVTSACLAGEVAGHLMDDRWEAAREAAAWYAEVFKDRYYLEVQGHDSEGQAALNTKIFTLGAELGLPVVATNDAHFLKESDHDAHDVLLCIGIGKDVKDQDRMHYDRGLYFKTRDEMGARFRGRDDVLENTLAIADQVDVQFGKKYHVPSFPLPPDVATENDLLVKLADEGAHARYGAVLAPEVEERLRYELGVILQTGYAGYFLIVADFIRAARDRGIPVGPGRGSAAGSLVAYALGITNVCPLKYDLLFERFLNPERVSMPDVDVDFCFERRGEVIEYVRQKYGKDSVCQIVTFGTMKSRAAVKDVGRVLGFTPAETDALAKFIPNAPNFSLTVAEAIDQVPDVARLYKSEPRYRELLDYAIALEGLSRHTGVPRRGRGDRAGAGARVRPRVHPDEQGRRERGRGQGHRRPVRHELPGEGGHVEDGLPGADDAHGAARRAQEHRGAHRAVARPRRDAVRRRGTYRMLRSGRTAGVFQFESSLATDVLRQMRCDRFDDLVASNALLRPGPLDTGMHKVYIRRKRGEEPVSYQLPEMEPILRETQGVITYQEQVMRIAQTLAASRSPRRRAAQGGGQEGRGAHQAGARQVRREGGRQGAQARRHRGHRRQIETFGRYGFNKSHSVAYSVVSYHTAYLKANYPADFMAALLELHRRHRLGGEVRGRGARDGDRGAAPRRQRERLQVHGRRREAHPLRLGAVRNVGEGAVDSVLAARAKDGPVQGLLRLRRARRPARVQQARVRGARARRRARRLGGHRAQYMAALDHAISEALLKQEERELGRRRCSASARAAGRRRSRSPRCRTSRRGRERPPANEKAILGFYVSGHPLEPFRAEAELFGTHKVAELGRWTPNRIVLACVITAAKRQISKRSGLGVRAPRARGLLGATEVLVFPEAWSCSPTRSRPTSRARRGRLLAARPGRRDAHVHRRAGHAARREAPVGRGGRGDRARPRRRARAGRDGRRARRLRALPRHGGGRAALARRARRADRALPLALPHRRGLQRRPQRAARAVGRAARETGPRFLTPRHGRPRPRIREAARGARDAHRRDEAPRRHAGARRARRARPAGAQARRPARRDLPQPRAHPARAGGPPPAAPLHARLPAARVHRLGGAARRPRLPRRRRHRRRLRAARRRERGGHRPPARPRHQGEPRAQLRHAQPRGLPQGAAAHEARREVLGPGGHAHRHPRARGPASARRSAGRARPSRATSSRWPGSRCRSSRR
jgi:DNA polymerase-3 subunit alpha